MVVCLSMQPCNELVTWSRVSPCLRLMTAGIDSNRYKHKVFQFSAFVSEKKPWLCLRVEFTVAPSDEPRACERDQGTVPALCVHLILIMSCFPSPEMLAENNDGDDRGVIRPRKVTAASATPPPTLSL